MALLCVTLALLMPAEVRMSRFPAVLLAAAFVATGCAGGGDGTGWALFPSTVATTTVAPVPDAAPATTTSPPYTPPPPPPVSPDPDPYDIPTDLYLYADVCTGETYDGARPYRGGGPHRMYVAVTAKDNPSSALDVGLSGPIGPVPKAWTTADVKAVQLVACVRVTGAPRLRVCDYTSGFRATLYARTFAVELREARTGRKVGPTVSLRTDDNDCTDSIFTRPGDAKTVPHQYGTLTARQLRAVFATRVEGPA
jgi:hypothetical protein